MQTIFNELERSAPHNSRALNWRSCLDPTVQSDLLKLQNRMKKYYETSRDYYQEIDFSAGTWSDESQLEAQDILKEAALHDSVLEIGCGRANILKSGKIGQKNYTGIDFSTELIRKNRKDYPEAHFYSIETIGEFPCESERYGFVFSHYVLEHCVFPNKFLDESVRVLRPGGVLNILCPNFLGLGQMSSQRVGFSEGTGREKLSTGRYWDALITGFDSKIKIPLYSSWLRSKARKQPRFFINMNPTCFSDTFKPDVDAVYATFSDEIRSYLGNSIKWALMSDALDLYAQEHNHIYLKGYKGSD